jgi:creatinine amidohydrolase
MNRSLTLHLRIRLGFIPLALSLSLGPLLPSPIRAQDANPLFTQEKVKNYLPHMSWVEVAELLSSTDVALIPVGSLEQHGKHLPLGTDFLAASEACKLVAQETDVLVVPVVMAGISAHHLGFAGSLTLSPALFEEVIFETVQNLIHHGVRKIAFYNGHGGNSASLANVINRINNSTDAAAVDLGEIQRSERESPFPAPAMDFHAGVGETSWMLYLTPQLVDMSMAENPVLTPPAQARKAWESMTGANAELVAFTHLFRPEKSGKKAASHEISSNGVFTTGNLAESSVARGKFRFDHFVEDAVRFIEEWKGIGPPRN